ncbi:hypothetical protein C1646_711343 [Rhizophagus diaphanus]|nr:hypothetical protein C1646_711343 [Rhizophagus diaphanus] [Rhizophagus sp. MUCL 43196]
MITIQEARTIAIKEINDCLNGQDSIELNYLSPIVEITNNELERSNQTWEKQIEQAISINEIDQIKDRVIANINKIGFCKRKQLQIMDYSYGDLIKRRQCFTYDDIYYIASDSKLMQKMRYCNFKRNWTGGNSINRL